MCNTTWQKKKKDLKIALSQYANMNTKTYIFIFKLYIVERFLLFILDHILHKWEKKKKEEENIRLRVRVSNQKITITFTITLQAKATLVSPKTAFSSFFICSKKNIIFIIKHSEDHITADGVVSEMLHKYPTLS